MHYAIRFNPGQLDEIQPGEQVLLCVGHHDFEFLANRHSEIKELKEEMDGLLEQGRIVHLRRPTRAHPHWCEHIAVGKR